MSRAKLYKIRKEALNEALKANHRTLRDLSNLLDRNYQALSRSINGEGLPMMALESIGRYLDRAPEYLTGATENNEITRGTIFSYQLHERQNLSFQKVLHDFMVCNNESYQDFTKEEHWELWDDLVMTLNVSCDRIRKRKEKNKHHDGKEESDGQH